ncbi:MAG: nuclear transport factor 2 family protein [Flavobacteriales bacterium]|nr:nuclear transport factor 2 family protein [Flavobacteriales bacterium]
MSNKALIAKFFEGLKQQDLDMMLSCYHENIIFSDPAFGILRKEKVFTMWKKILKEPRDLRIEYSSIEADEENGSAKWEAWYSFSVTGKLVHNKIESRFVFKDNLIAEQHDSFFLRKWAAQAFGLKGRLIGGTSYFRERIQHFTMKALERFNKK